MKRKIVKKLNIMELLNTNPLSNEYKFKSKILNGVLLSSAIQNTLTNKISSLKQKIEEELILENSSENRILNNSKNFISNKNKIKFFTPPKLKIILVGERMDSKVYVENKLKMCKSIGMEGELKIFPNSTYKEEILEEIENSNNDDEVHGIIVQLPLPEKLNLSRTEILSKVDLKKDVDGLNPMNQGKILQMSISECLIPPTAMGVLELLRLAIDYENNLDNYITDYLSNNIFDDQPVNLSEKEVTVLGRGLTAGLPLSILMQKCNGTVTTCHSKTKNIKSKCENADIVISAVGKCNLITMEFVKEDSIVIDVGINVNFDSYGNKIITGDVDFNHAVEKVKYITPVPGGVGKMTVIMLLKNVLKAWGNLNNINLNDKI